MRTVDPHPRPSARRALGCALVLTALLGGVGTAAAEPVPAAGQDERVRKPERRLYAGMWTVHFRDRERGVDGNQLLGVSLGRLYAGTFINSFDRRAYTAGIQGEVTRWQPGRFGVGVGYRAGLVTGYDERFIALAAHTPVLPLLQPRVNIDGRRLGVELTYSGVISSAALNVRF